MNQLIEVTGNEPISVDALARNLRLMVGEVYQGDERALLQQLTTAARAWAEGFTHRCLIPQRQRYTVYFDQQLRVACRLLPDLLRVDSIQYRPQLATAEVQSLLSAGLVKQSTETILRLQLPSPRACEITIEATHGLSTTPPAIQHAILMLASYWYEQREAASPLTIKDVPYGVSSLLQPFRIEGFS